MKHLREDNDNAAASAQTQALADHSLYVNSIDTSPSEELIDNNMKAHKRRMEEAQAKRTVQNKLAQRAFRERRKNRIQHLEQIEVMYSVAIKEIADLKAENELLKTHLNKLQEREQDSIMTKMVNENNSKDGSAN